MSENDVFDEDFPCTDDLDLNPSTSSDVKAEPSELSSFQKARMEKNRLKALTLKKARLQGRPYEKHKENKDILTGDKKEAAKDKKVS